MALLQIYDNDTGEEISIELDDEIVRFGRYSIHQEEWLAATRYLWLAIPLAVKDWWAKEVRQRVRKGK